MIADYTSEELLLLADMWDSEVKHLISPGLSSCRDHMETYLRGTTPNRSLHLFLEELAIYNRTGEKPLLTVPLEEVPLYINHSSPAKVLLARWRLQVAK
jgi:hypothetical protein